MTRAVELVTEVELPARPHQVEPWLASLDAYPAWMGLVHRAVPEPGSNPPAWQVDLRARIGPLARSKRLRMVRSAVGEANTLGFERAELDGRNHGRWSLRAELHPTELQRPDGALPGTRVRVTLRYEGAHWASGVLERVLHDEIEKSKARLVELVSGGHLPGPTH